MNSTYFCKHLLNLLPMFCKPLDELSGNDNSSYLPTPHNPRTTKVVFGFLSVFFNSIFTIKLKKKKITHKSITPETTIVSMLIYFPTMIHISKSSKYFSKSNYWFSFIKQWKCTAFLGTYSIELLDWEYKGVCRKMFPLILLLTRNHAHQMAAI